MKLCEALGKDGITASPVSTDAFMKDRAERNSLGISGYDPRSIDIHRLARAIEMFLSGRDFKYHPYDNRTGTKQRSPSMVSSCQVLVVEGIHSLHPAVANLMHWKVFMASDEATLHQMRYRANIQKRGMSAEEAGARIPAEWQDYRRYVEPLSASADWIVQVDQAFNYRPQ